MVAWLYGTVMLAGRRSGYVVTLLGAILGAVVPFIHLVATGGVVGGANAPSSGSYFFVWNHLALGSTSVFAGILSARGLWSLRRGRLRLQDAPT